jgi:hypothetical protein
MFFRVYIKGKTHKYGIKTFELWGKKQLRLQPGSIYWGTSNQLITQHGVQCWQVVWKNKRGRATVCTWTDGSPVQRSVTIYGVVT